MEKQALLPIGPALALVLSASVAFGACSAESDPPGSSNGTGGSSTGGVATGGTQAATGGTPAATGGKAATGGAVGTGGVSAGGKAGTGGQPATGGTSATGGAAGMPATGGAGGTAAGAGGKGTGGAGGASAGAGGSVGGASGGAGGGAAGGPGEAKSAGCGKARTLMDGRKTISSGGQNREYILRVPQNYDNNKPYRLIIAYHWLNGNANQVANGGMGGSTEKPYYGLWDLAENSTIFVAPEGLNAGWENTNGRDLTLTDAILAQVQGDLCIDNTRIFATGFSYGAGMSYAVACARANVFRGVALYAGAQLSGCMGGTSPVAYFHAHGSTDNVLRIAQGRQLRDRFVMNNGCTNQSPMEPGDNSGRHICTSYEGCSAGYPVRWCAHGGGHNPTEKDSGQNESWVPGEAWNFIKQF
jgi:poly(3-hydroxybutyrate) depolymerase